MSPPRGSPNHRPALGGHRLIGQGRGAALVRPDGEIDWWCPNRFDATPLLWSLLDGEGASSTWAGTRMATFDGCPAGPTAATSLHHDEGRVALWDALVSHGGTTLLIRLVKAESSRITLTHRLRSGGFDAPWQQWRLSSTGAGAPESALRPDPEQPSAGLRIIGGTRHRICGPWLESDVEARPGTWAGLAMAVDGCGHGSADGSLTGSAADLTTAQLVDLVMAAEQAERRSLDHVRLPHHHPNRVIDALRVLHALTDPATGAPVASPTTSLPEAIGGTRQFDYRYTWLRDSANAVAAASLLGHLRASARYLDFIGTLLEELQQSGGVLTPLTTTTGAAVPGERDVADVSGWGESRPVRVGNQASEQRQIDAVSSVLEAIWIHIGCGGRMTAGTWTIVDRLATRIADVGVEPSSGIWELREPQLLTSEDIARWHGLDRAIRLRRLFRPWVRRPSWRPARDLARQRVERALDVRTGLLPQTYARPPVPDAASLLVALSGMLPRRDPRLHRLVRSTIAALEEGAFLRRYPPADDGFEGIEATFVPASWWAVSALAIIGDLPAAERRADEMCLHLPPLQPEEWDVETDQGLGNTPLLWSHTEAARALYRLHQERVRRRFGTIGLVAWRVSRYLRLRHRIAHRRRHRRQEHNDVSSTGGTGHTVA